MTKECNRCNEVKSITEFYKMRGNRDGYATDCKACRKVAYPSQTPQNVLERVYRTRLRNREYVWSYLLEHPCVDCQEADPIVLEFDHVREDKLSDVGKLVHNTRSIAVIQTEIDKCDVVCANCHRRRTAKSQQWDKAISFSFLSGD